MKEKKYKRNKIKSIRTILIIVIIYFTFVIIKQQLRINEFNIEQQYYSSLVNEKNKEIEILSKTNTDINTDEYLEKIAREELGLVKPYEKIFIDINN